ncbi:MAG: NRDE family protein [Polyangiaceae bacterium]|nr:NRDE family protein [Polyangiaceae bacterium]
MCTLLVATSKIAGAELVVVANRDERMARPSLPPQLWPAGFIAPRDELAHGTWLGINRHGVFVGITNRHLGPQDAARTSRGAIVVSALEEPSARQIHTKMAALQAKSHNGFHLVYADEREVLATISDGEHLAQLSLGSGVHVVTERSFGAGDERARVRRAMAAWSRLGPRPGEHSLDVARLTGVLAEHDPTDPFSGTCLHLTNIDYATRSSMVLALGKDRRTMLWAEGAPCTTPFTAIDLSSLFETLNQRC